MARALSSGRFRLLGATAAVVLASAMYAAPASAATNLLYYGGHVMGPMHNVAVNWGPASNEPAGYLNFVNGYFTDVAASAYDTPTDVFASLYQYDTRGRNGQADGQPGSNQPVVHEQPYGGLFSIAPASSATTVANATIKAELNAQIAAGHIPAPGAPGPATAYYVLFPGSSYTVTYGSSMSGTQFCDYHHTNSYQGTTYAYAVVMTWSPGTAGNGGCGADPNYLNNQTMNIAHQQGEMITDPEIGTFVDSGASAPTRPLAWYASGSSGGEVGDANNCSSQPATNVFNGHSYTIQKLWSNAAQACVGSATGLAAPSAAFTSSGGSSLSQSFDGSGSSSANGNHSIYAYDWSFGDGSTATGVAPAHTYATSGDYSVTLKVTDDLGFVNRVTKTVSVVVAGPPSGGGPQPAGPQPTGPPPPDTVAPLIQSASASPTTFAVDLQGPAEVSAGAAPRGTTFSYTLSEASRAVFTLARRSPGRKSGKRCVKPKRSNRTKKRCIRYTLAGSFAVQSAAGSNLHRFSGRIGTRRLKPGKYRVTLVATDAAGNRSTPKRFNITIVKK